MARWNVLLIPRLDEDAESLCRRLKRAMLAGSVFRDVARHAFAEGPGARRRRKSRLARAKFRKAERRRAEQVAQQDRFYFRES